MPCVYTLCQGILLHYVQVHRRKTNFPPPGVTSHNDDDDDGAPNESSLGSAFIGEMMRQWKRESPVCTCVYVVLLHMWTLTIELRGGNTTGWRKREIYPKKFISPRILPLINWAEKRGRRPESELALLSRYPDMLKSLLSLSFPPGVRGQRRRRRLLGLGEARPIDIYVSKKRAHNVVWRGEKQMWLNDAANESLSHMQKKHGLHCCTESTVTTTETPLD